MATAKDLLARTATPETEPHIVINPDRTVEVPPELRLIAVQYDLDIETVTFDAPRYWDEHDLSKMRIYIYYRRPDKEPGAYRCTDVTVDPADNSMMHFTWTISDFVTEVPGTLSFLVCAKAQDIEGNLINRWGTRINEQMVIDTGMNATEEIIERHPDIIDSITHIVYVGSDTPPSSADIWIDPTAGGSLTEEWEFEMDDGTTVTKTVVVT